MLGHFYPAASQILSADVGYEGGQIDALLDFGTDVVIFEFITASCRRQKRGPVFGMIRSFLNA